jgi:c-di-GMP-binding flagellar brake protein YcgR
MFERTVSMLKRLVSSGPPEEERRVRVRYPANLETTFEPVNGTEVKRLSGRVRNISASGINLVVPHHFEPGSMLSIDLPGAKGQSSYSVLACVVHTTATAEGEWTLGCTFSRDVGDDVLRQFGALRQKPATPDDNRTWTRFPCTVKALCQTVADPQQEPWPVQVLNISPTGIGLLVARAIDTGTLLSLELQGHTEAAAHTMLACVVHVTVQPDGQWALGCNFIRELTEEELQALL